MPLNRAEAMVVPTARGSSRKYPASLSDEGHSAPTVPSQAPLPDASVASSLAPYAVIGAPPLPPPRRVTPASRAASGASNAGLPGQFGDGSAAGSVRTTAPMAPQGYDAVPAGPQPTSSDPRFLPTPSPHHTPALGASRSASASPGLASATPGLATGSPGAATAAAVAGYQETRPRPSLARPAPTSEPFHNVGLNISIDGGGYSRGGGVGGVDSDGGAPIASAVSNHRDTASYLSAPEGDVASEVRVRGYPENARGLTGGAGAPLSNPPQRPGQGYPSRQAYGNNAVDSNPSYGSQSGTPNPGYGNPNPGYGSPNTGYSNPSQGRPSGNASYGPSHPPARPQVSPQYSQQSVGSSTSSQSASASTVNVASGNYSQQSLSGSSGYGGGGPYGNNSSVASYGSGASHSASYGKNSTGASNPAATYGNNGSGASNTAMYGSNGSSANYGNPGYGYNGNPAGYGIPGNNGNTSYGNTGNTGIPSPSMQQTPGLPPQNATQNVNLQHVPSYSSYSTQSYSGYAPSTNSAMSRQNTSASSYSVVSQNTDFNPHFSSMSGKTSGGYAKNPHRLTQTSIMSRSSAGTAGYYDDGGRYQGQQSVDERPASIRHRSSSESLTVDPYSPHFNHGYAPGPPAYGTTLPSGYSGSNRAASFSNAHEAPSPRLSGVPTASRAVSYPRSAQRSELSYIQQGQQGPQAQPGQQGQQVQQGRPPYPSHPQGQGQQVQPTYPPYVPTHSPHISSLGANSLRSPPAPSIRSVAAPSVHSMPGGIRPPSNTVIVKKIYPALLSHVALAFRQHVNVGERFKDTLLYHDAFDGREAVDRLAQIVRSKDRNLALLLGRALEAQRLFHDVVYLRRLRDSPAEIYKFRTATAESQLCGVFTVLTACYVPTCAPGNLCYSVSCPRRLPSPQQSNLATKLMLPARPDSPTLSRSSSVESLVDAKPPGALWISSVPREVAEAVSDSEKKRQEAINEIIYTESGFVKDIEYLRDSWIKPLRELDVIPAARREDFIVQVFWNVLELHQVNMELSERLLKRQKQSHVVEKIGDIFLHLIPKFEPFVKYGSHQLYGKHEFEKERATNPAFAKFVEDTERKPESRKLELNAYLTMPTTRLARYPLLLEACLKHTHPENPDAKMIPQAVMRIRGFLNKVNIETGRAENSFNLAQLDRQIQAKPGEPRPDLQLRKEGREILHKGPLKKKSGSQSDSSADISVFLFDHMLLMAKARKGGELRIYRKPIPLEFLVAGPVDDATVSRNASVRPQSLLLSAQGDQAPPLDRANTKGFALSFIYIGRKGFQVVLWASSWAGRKKWLEKIAERQAQLRMTLSAFITQPLTQKFFRQITCAVAVEPHTLLVGNNAGVYRVDLRASTAPVLVLSLQFVTQLEIVQECGLLIVLAEGNVTSYYIDHIDARDHQTAKRAKKYSTGASLIRAGHSSGRTFVCIIKLNNQSSTNVKILELSAQAHNRGKRGQPFRKLLPPSVAAEALEAYKELYVPMHVTSVHFLKSKLCFGTPAGFEVIDLVTLDTQRLLDPDDRHLDIVKKRYGARPLAIYRVETDFLLCYDCVAFYVNKNGKRSRPDWAIAWEGVPTRFALHLPYVVAFDPQFIEVRHVVTGALVQVIPGTSILPLYVAESAPRRPPFHPQYGQQPGQYPPQNFHILVSDADRIYNLRFIAGQKLNISPERMTTWF